MHMNKTLKSNWTKTCATNCAGLKTFAISFAVALALGGSLVANAADFTWSGGTTGGKNDWNTKNNWAPNTGNGGPTLSDNIFFAPTTIYNGVTNSAAAAAGDRKSVV